VRVEGGEFDELGNLEEGTASQRPKDTKHKKNSSEKYKSLSIRIDGNPHDAGGDDDYNSNNNNINNSANGDSSNAPSSQHPLPAFSSPRFTPNGSALKPAFLKSPILSPRVRTAVAPLGMEDAEFSPVVTPKKGKGYD